MRMPGQVNIEGWHKEFFRVGGHEVQKPELKVSTRRGRLTGIQLTHDISQSHAQGRLRPLWSQNI